MAKNIAQFGSFKLFYTKVNKLLPMKALQWIYSAKSYKIKIFSYLKKLLDQITRGFLEKGSNCLEEHYTLYLRKVF